MLPANHTIPRNIVLLSALLLHCCVSQAAAHIEKGAMPDSVAEMEYRIMLEFEPNNLEVRNLLGMVLYRNDRLHEAEKEFHYVLGKAPQNHDALDALGLINYKRADYQLAKDFFKKAIAMKPDDMLVYYHLGQALEKLGDMAGAAEAYKSGLARKVTAPNKLNNAEQRQVLLEALKNIHEEAAKAEAHNS
jgi:tetratricopeptide (TPR) repeat protein